MNNDDNKCKVQKELHDMDCKLLPEVYVISKEEVEEQIVNAEKFCEAVQEYLKESGPQ